MSHAMSHTVSHTMHIARHPALLFVRRCIPCTTSHVARSILATFALLAGLAPAFFFAPAASAHERAANAAGGSVHAVRLDSPAVVRIIKVESGRVICKACYQGQDIPFPLDGTSSYSAIFSGSGTLISPDGYILTADHVADAGLADNDIFRQQAINELAQKAGISVDQATQDFQESQQAGQIQFDIHVTQLTAFLSTAYIGAVRDATQVGDPQVALPVTRVVASSPVEKQDVAIVKVEGHDLPNVRIAPTGSVHVQDRVSAIAFPADADVGSDRFVDGDFTHLLNPQQGEEAELTDLLTPTVEGGQIIAIKRLADGTSYYQTDQIGNHGSSGGAVINDQGDIVGFLDALNDVNSGNPTRVADLITNDVIASYVQQAGITDSGQGAFASRWTQAVDALDNGDACQAAQARDGLRQLSTDYPRFSAIQPFMLQAQSESAGARCLPS
ncbi:MAG TPA: serine protease, partial [Ktedonobacterales bacterium]